MKRSICSTFVLSTIVLLASLLLGLTPITSVAGQESKHVFVLNSFNRGYSWTDNMLRGIDDAFSSSGVKVETYVTFMDMKRIPPTPQYFQQLKELIREGYKGVRFDAVLACDNDAFEFTKKYRDELFPGVPAVFSSINDFDQRMLEGRRDITGTSENTDYTGTIKAALQLLPATKNIVVVTDNTTTGKAHRSAVEKIRLDFPQSLGFTYISLADMTMDELAEKLSKLERGSIVLLLQHFKDKNGTSHTVQQSTPLLSKSSSVPVFVLTDIRIGLGTLGGHVVSGYHHGEAAAQMVVKILKGADVKSIPLLLDNPNKYMFDYSVMQRFKISEKDLPKGSILINKPVSVLDRYRPYLYAIICAFIVLSGFIGFLLLEIRKRKKTEEELRLSEVSLQTVNDKLQEQNDELQMNEEELRSQNDELLSVEEMLRVQINEYEASQKLLHDREKALSRQNGLFSSLLKIIPIGVFMVEVPSGKPLVANEAALNILGRGILPDASRHNLAEVYKAFKIGSHDPYPPEEMPILLGMNGVTSYIDDMEVERPDGTKTLLEIFGSPVSDEQGHVWASLVSFIDITERKLAEKDLRESNEILSLFMHHAPIYTFIKEVTPTESRVLLASENFQDMVGIPGSEMVGKSMEELFPAEIASKITKDDWAVVAEGVVLKVDENFNGRSYTTVKSPLIKGEKTLLAGFTIDITERKQVEEELRDANEFLALTQRSAGAGLWSWDFASGELIWSPEQYQMFGVDPVVGVPNFDLWRSVVHPDDLKTAESNIRDAIRDHVQLFNEYRIIKNSGEVRWIYAMGQINYDSSNEPRRMSGICLDITERKKAEEEKQTLELQFQHTQKLESLGVLAGGIAHDFNNILAIIMGYCSLTKMDYEDAEKHIPEIEKAAERAAALCRQMLAYAGKAQLTKTQINMWVMVDEMVTMLKSTLPKNAIIKSDLSAKIPYISADESQIRQIVMNLIINASEAIGTEQGEIQVSLSRTTVTDGQATTDYHSILIPLGEYVCLEVTDNGCGMDEETKWRIFEPFYTTKFSGRGLGMSAVLGIIKSHNGALQLHSQLGQGTTFKIYLPVQKSDSARDENTSASVPSAPWQGSGTILLVEDEDQVRLIAKTLLKNFGFTVLEAVNGKEAFELYQNNRADITLVFTDMGMPIMDGYELFYKLKNLNPELPIIISSGYGDAEVSARIGSDNIAGLISKPYNPDKLREVLKRVVEGAEQ